MSNYIGSKINLISNDLESEKNQNELLINHKINLEEQIKNLENIIEEKVDEGTKHKKLKEAKENEQSTSTTL